MTQVVVNLETYNKLHNDQEYVEKIWLACFFDLLVADFAF